jgi:hypothetical protein
VPESGGKGGMAGAGGGKTASPFLQTRTTKTTIKTTMSGTIRNGRSNTRCHIDIIAGMFAPSGIP